MTMVLGVSMTLDDRGPCLCSLFLSFSDFCPSLFMVFFHEFVLGVSSPKGSWGGRCCRARQRIVPRGFVPQGKLGRPILPRSPENCVSGFRPPREAGAASMTPRLPAGEALPFVPGVLSPRGRSSSFLEVSSPKGSWGGVNDAALASGCRTAVARRWAIHLFSPTMQYDR